MVEETLLSSLCSICNTTKSKYQCPACAARTCSLPCYKRHQTRALCTGKRDPTKFMKKSQLATPAGIDHDFNFITGIERELEKAERDVNDRGLGAVSDPQALPRQPTVKGQLFNRDFNAAGVKVVRAPQGLSRQKENKTHRSSKGKIVWTVEWIREDRTRILTECPASLTFDQLQPFPTARKRKHPAGPTSTIKKADSLPPIKNKNSEDAPIPPPAKVRRLDDGDKAGSEEPKLPSPRRLTQTNNHPDNREIQRTGPDHDAQVASALRPSLHLDGPDTESLPSEYHFFLLKPQTSSSRHVLIPLSSTSTLAQCLRGRTVLEFPTIYAFPSPMERLPEGFMLEDEYLEQEGEEQKEFEDLLKHAHPEILQALRDGDDKRGGAENGEELDSRKILDVLKQDLGGFV